MRKKKTRERTFVLRTLLLAFAMLSFISMEAQKVQFVSLRANNMPLVDALKSVEKQSDYNVLFVIKDVQGIRVTVTISHATAPEAVRQLITGQPLKMSVNKNYIRIQRDERNVQSQKHFVLGRVIDSQGNPLAGVTIKAENNATSVSNAEGDFALPVDELSPRVTFSYLGMLPQTLRIKSDRHVTITMEDDAKAVDEVVVTGYQTMNKRESASAISSVKAEDIMVDGVSSIDQMLQGRIPGVAVMNTSGEPSATPKIRIRGNATINGNKAPVWVVDGVIQEQNIPFTASDLNSDDAQYLIGNAISGLNPQDIETITVLKDASATAIYGVKAANGVIVITTKKGNIGKPRITYNGSLSINTRPSYDDYNLMNSQQRVLFSKSVMDAGFPIGLVPQGETYEGTYEELLGKKITLDEFKQRVGRLQTRNTDWFDLLFRNNITNTHTANISGGMDRLRYYMSAGYSDVQGSALDSYSRRFDVMANVDARVNSHIDVQAKLSFSSTSNRGYHNSVNPFDYAYSTSRTIPAYNDDGSYYSYYRAAGSTGREDVTYNILRELDNTGQKSRMDNVDLLLNLNVKILPGLTYQGTFSYAIGNTNTRNWATDKSYYVSSSYRGYEYGKYSNYDTEYMDSELPYGGVLTQGHTRHSGYTIRNQAEYRNIFADVHSVDVIGGIEARRSAYDGFSQTGYGWTPEYGELFNPVITDRYRVLLESGAVNPVNTNSFTQVASFYGILSYGYNNRYIFNFNIRSDGSNKFGSNPKYRWLPTYSFALRWNVMNEKFMKNIKWIDNIDVRASYGLQGNISENNSPSLILQVGQRDYVLGLPTSSISQYPNPDLRWEKTHSWNAAVDFSFLRGRIRGGIDVYGKHTKDLIIAKTIAASNGTTSINYNSGTMNNRGFEGFVNFGLLKTKQWEWRFGVNFSRNVNEIIYANEEDYTQSEVINRMLSGNQAVENAPIGSIYAYHFAGINEDNGLPMFYTHDGKKVIRGMQEDMDLVRMGSIYPKLTGGFDTQLSWKRWSLGLNFTYNIGNVGRLPNYYTNRTLDPNANYTTDWLHSWLQEGSNAEFPSAYDVVRMRNYFATEEGAAYDGYDRNSRGNIVNPTTLYNYSDVRVAKADFLKLKLISLSYNFPQKLLRHLCVKTLMLRFQMTNIFTIANSKWHGLDPETGGSGIPQTPVYSLTANVSF